MADQMGIENVTIEMIKNDHESPWARARDLCSPMETSGLSSLDSEWTILQYSLSSGYLSHAAELLLKTTESLRLPQRECEDHFLNCPDPGEPRNTTAELVVDAVYRDLFFRFLMVTDFGRLEEIADTVDKLLDTVWVIAEFAKEYCCAPGIDPDEICPEHWMRKTSWFVKKWRSMGWVGHPAHPVCASVAELEEAMKALASGLGALRTAPSRVSELRGKVDELLRFLHALWHGVGWKVTLMVDVVDPADGKSFTHIHHEMPPAEEVADLLEALEKGLRAQEEAKEGVE